MKKQFGLATILMLICLLFISACGNTVAPVPSVTTTPDPCATENIEAEVKKLHNLMREFDDGSSLASGVPASQLADVIPNLQRIRRDTEDLIIPPCLETLKSYAVSHMNTFINTLINLIGYANGTVSKDVIDQGLALARQEHDNYTIELARVLGLPTIPADTVPTATPGS